MTGTETSESDSNSLVRWIYTELSWKYFTGWSPNWTSNWFAGCQRKSNVRTILIVSVISVQTILMSPRSCFYFTSRLPWLRYKCPKVNHKASVFTVNIRTHHKQTYSQRITFCSPIILLENPPFILMEIWIKYSQTEIRELLRLFGEKILSDLLHTVRFTEVYVSHSETMGL